MGGIQSLMLQVEYWLVNSLRMWIIMKLSGPLLSMMGATASRASANFEC